MAKDTVEHITVHLQAQGPGHAEASAEGAPYHAALYVGI